MSLLNNKGNNTRYCEICGKPIKFLSAMTLSDGGECCINCCKDAGLISTLNTSKTTYSKNDIMVMIESNNKQNEFKPTRRIGTYLFIDENTKEWAVPDGLEMFGLSKPSKIYRYNDVVAFELLEDGETSTSGGLGRALIGAACNPTGAVVGAITGKKKVKETCNSLKLKVTVNDIAEPIIYIEFLRIKCKKNSPMFKEAAAIAQEVVSAFQIMCNENNSTQHEKETVISSGADEIRKYKELLDEGIITEEEFIAKKKQILAK